MNKIFNLSENILNFFNINKLTFCDIAEKYDRYKDLNTEIQPTEWQINFQFPITPEAKGIINFHHDIFFFLVFILIFVSYLLFSSNYYFGFKKIFKKSLKFTHNSKLEIIWTIIPTLILLLIVFPSLSLLYALEDFVEPHYTVKVIGHQWYWSYQISDFERKIKFDSYLVKTDKLLKDPFYLGKPRNLTTDTHLPLPARVPVRFLVTSVDVIHSWAIPSAGIKIDACPGRLNQVISTFSHYGTFYGQCSEICGAYHGFMPIVLKVYNKYHYWLYVNTMGLGNLSFNDHDLYMDLFVRYIEYKQHKNENAGADTFYMKKLHKKIKGVAKMDDTVIDFFNRNKKKTVFNWFFTHYIKPEVFDFARAYIKNVNKFNGKNTNTPIFNIPSRPSYWTFVKTFQTRNLPFGGNGALYDFIFQDYKSKNASHFFTAVNSPLSADFSPVLFMKNLQSRFVSSLNPLYVPAFLNYVNEMPLAEAREKTFEMFKEYNMNEIHPVKWNDFKKAEYAIVARIDNHIRENLILNGILEKNEKNPGKYVLYGINTIEENEFYFTQFAETEYACNTSGFYKNSENIVNSLNLLKTSSSLDSNDTFFENYMNEMILFEKKYQQNAVEGALTHGLDSLIEFSPYKDKIREFVYNIFDKNAPNYNFIETETKEQFVKLLDGYCDKALLIVHPMSVQYGDEIYRAISRIENLNKLALAYHFNS